MNNLHFVLEKLEPSHHAVRYSGQHVLRHAHALELIQRTRVHKLHAVVHTTLDEERAVKFDDLVCDGTVEDVEFHEDRAELARVELEADLFHCHEDVGGLVQDLFDCSVVPVAELFEELELGHVNFEGCAV